MVPRLKALFIWFRSDEFKALVEVLGINEVYLKGILTHLWTLGVEKNPVKISFLQKELRASRDDLFRLAQILKDFNLVARITEDEIFLVLPNTRNRAIYFGALPGKGKGKVSPDFSSSSNLNPSRLLPSRECNSVVPPSESRSPLVPSKRVSEMNRLGEITGSAVETWKETLKTFGVNRGISGMEEMVIARAVMAHGEEMVSLALLGARYEAKTKNFDPKNYLRITRILDPGTIDKFANLGAMRFTFEKNEVTESSSLADKVFGEAIDNATRTATTSQSSSESGKTETETKT